jgi:Lrp/AsnC family transcriptional regulator, leucine-responsive regulatory protein
MSIYGTIDEIDERILNALTKDARTSNAELARQIGMAPSAILERVRKLEERGVLEGYAPRINPRALGLRLLAFVFVRTDEGVGALTTASHLAKAAEVQEVHHVAGEDCLLVKLRARDTDDLSRILKEVFGPMKSIRSTRTTIVLETIKETSILPIGRLAKEARR